MSHNGLDLTRQEGVSAGLILQGTELCHELRASVDPAVQGTDGTFGITVGLVKQGKFGLAIRTGFHFFDV